MSMTWNTTVTNQGIQLQTKQVQGSTLAFTRAVAGSGTVPVVNLKEQTAVSNIQQTLNIETVTMGVMQYVMNILLSNTNLQTGYNLSQVGLYATDPDVGEILFAIAQLNTPKAIPSYTDSPGYNLELSMTFANTQGANVTIVPDLAGYITQGAAQTLISNEVDPIQDNIVAIQHLGAKNLLPNTMTDVTISGCEFTVADDGKVTADGTASAYTWTAYINRSVTLPSGTYTLTGCPEGGSSTTYYLQAFTGDATSPTAAYRDTGSGVTFTLTEETSVAVRIVINGTVDNLVFAPMIRPEAMTDPTYEPYAMSNQEITERIENLNVTVDVNMLATEWTAEASLGTITIERVRFLNGSYYAVGSAGAVFSSPDGKTWTNLNTTGISTEIEDIAYSDILGIYVALTNGRPYWSTNAVAWTASDVDWNDDAIALCYGESSGNGIFVMTSQLYAWYSTDGKTWTQASITGTSAGFFREIAYAPDVNGRPMFVAVGDMGETMYSLNGRRWYEGGIVADTGLNTIAYAYGRFMISGNNSQYKVTYYSLDGLNWTEISDDIILYRIVAYRGIFVGFGQNNTIYTSLDGESWNLQGTIPSSVGTFNDISSAGELLFAHNNYQVTGILAYNAGMVSTPENVSDLSGLLNNILPNKEQIYKLDEQVAESAAAIDDLNTKAGQSTAISMFSFDDNDNVVKTYDETDKKTTEERLGLINETNVDAAMQGYTKNKTAIDNINEDIEGAKTVTGSIITVQDAAPINAVDVEAKIEPIQDLHGYDNPWVGGAGKNLLNTTASSTTIRGVTFTVNSDKSITATGTATGGSAFLPIGEITLNEGTYILSGDKDGETSKTNLYLQSTGGATYNYGSPFTINETETYVAYIAVFNGNTVNQTFYPQLEIGTSATEYEPYSNICPISGSTECEINRVGFNQWDEEWELGTFDIDGNEVSANDRIRAKNYILCEPNTTYYYRGTKYAYFVFYDKLKNFVAGSYVAKAPNTTIQIPNNAHYIRFRIAPEYGTTYNHDICINISDTTKNGTYEPYKGEEVAIPLGQTVYGGTLDVNKGLLTITSVNVELGSLNWIYDGARFYVGLMQAKKTEGESKQNAICSNYRWSNIYGVNNSFFISIGRYLSIFDSSYTDAATFKTALQNSNAQLVYELASPTTIQLTPTQIKMLENTNTLYANTGDITIEYQPNNAIGEAVMIAQSTADNTVFITTPPYKKNWTAGTGVSETLYDVTYGNGRFVAVANAGNTYYSIDGINWTAGSRGASTTLLGVTYGNKRFVAVGFSGATCYSADGINWTAGTGASGILYDVTYGNGRFVAVGESGATYYSTDGINWTAGTGVSDDLNGVAYFNGIFVAVGFFGATYYSADGINWTSGTGASETLYDVTYGNGRFLAVGNAGATYYSTDGINWTAGTRVRVDLKGVAYFNGIFVAVGNNEATYDTYYSTDGINWASITEVSEIINGVTYGNGQFVAVGNLGATYYLRLTSQTMTLPELSNLLNPLTIYQEVIRFQMGTFTVNSALGNPIVNGIEVKQENKVIEINGYLTGISIFNGTRSKLGVISGVDMPTGTIRDIGGINTSGIVSINNIAYIEITMQGDVYVTPLADAGAIAFNITYIAG